MPQQRDRVVMRLIEDEMKQSFLDYSMSVIVQRALPDVRDGLKPVHRRILFSMHEAGLSPNRPFKKSATVVGDVLGKYHPHGDSAVYDAMVRMVQDFSLRYPLVAGQGNFGSIDGDSAAAYRYTEAKLSPLATELLADIDKETVDFTPNFDDRLMEPVVLPARVPNLLINGSSGIAVGMSTNVPPHNLREVIGAAVHLLDHPECSIDDLMRYVPGPDFPTGGIIVGREGIRQAYETGRGRLAVQGRVGREVRRGGREQLVVTELPYATSKTRLIEQIADLARTGKVPDIADLRDESDRDGIRMVVELKRGADAKKVVRALFKWTSLQTTFGVISLALVSGAPVELTLKQMLEHFRDHRIEVVVRRSRWELQRSEAEAHLLEGLLHALTDIDRVVSIIRGSDRKETAAERLQSELGLTALQADAILMMRLYRLTRLEARDLSERLAGLRERIADLQTILADPGRQVAEIRRELLDLAEKYGDARRTRIVEAKPESLIESMVAQEEVVVAVSHEGYAKQIPMYLFRRRIAAGKPVSDLERHPSDFIEYLFPSSTADQLLFFTISGQAFTLPVSEIPEAERSSRGRPLEALLGASRGERLAALLPFPASASNGTFIFVTRSGTVKRTAVDQFGSYRAGGVAAITLRPGDRLVDVHASDGTADLLLVSSDGRVIRFPEAEVPEVGRTAQGVRGIKLADGEQLVGSVLVRRDAEVCGVTARGFGLRIPTTEIGVQKRDGRGVPAFAPDRATGRLVGALEVLPADALVLVGEGEPRLVLATEIVAGERGGAPAPISGASGPVLELARAGERPRPKAPRAGADPDLEVEADDDPADAEVAQFDLLG